MMQTATAGAEPGAITPASALSGKPAGSLLLWGVLAGPHYELVGLAQAHMRDGFDLRHHALSLLSNGSLGWIQVANFVLSGIMVIAGAIGMRRALRRGPGGTWAPMLIGLYGTGLVAAGIFRPDPALGFPPGTPPGPPAHITLAGTLHFVSGAVGFLALILGCFVMARAFSRRGRSWWARYSVVTGILFFAGFAGIASGSGKPWLNVAFGIAVVVAWAWLSAVSWRLMRDVTRG
jgi:hypothetical protein